MSGGAPPQATPSVDPRFDTSRPPPRAERDGWYYWRIARPYPDHAMRTIHYCELCANESTNTELRPTEVETHLLQTHGMELDAYVIDYGHRKPGTIDSIAQWRTA